MADEDVNDAADGDVDDEPQTDQPQSSDTDKGSDGKNWEAEVQRLNKEAEKWRSLARKHEGRAKENADAAAKAKSVEDQIAELRSQLAERDVADVERNGRMAMTQVHAALAEAGIKKADAAGFLELVDPTTLLTDGQPDEKAIGKLAESVKKLAGRVTPDFDQGRKGGNAPPNMNDLIRRAAGVRG
jgi:hypothetical protein